MLKRQYKFILLLVLISINIPAYLFAQNWKEILSKAQDYRENKKDSTNAIRYANKALTFAESKYGKESSYYFTTLNYLGDLYAEFGNYKKALAYYDTSLAIINEISGDMSLNYVTTLHDKGLIYMDMLDFSHAEEALGYAYAFRPEKKGVPLETVENSQWIIDLAIVTREIGKYQESEELFLEAIALLKKIHADKGFYYAVDLKDFAALYLKMGEYAKAETLALESLKIHNALGIVNFDKNQTGIAGTLMYLAQLYAAMGNYSKVEELITEGTALFKRAYGDQDVNYAHAIRYQARLYTDIGEFAKAEPIYLTALNIYKSLFGEKSDDYASTSNRLAEVYQKMGKFDQAETLMLAAISTLKKNANSYHTAYKETQIGLANLYSETGYFSKAEKLYNEVIALDSNAHNQNEIIDGMAKNYDRMGNFIAADSLFRKGKELILADAKANFTFLSEVEKEKYINTITDYFSSYYSFYLRNFKREPKLAAEAFDIALKTKGMILNSGIEMRRTIINSENKPAIKLYQKWIGNKATLLKQSTLPLANQITGLKLLQELVIDQEKELTRFYESINKAKINLSTAAVQQKLKENEVSIEFITFNYNNPFKKTDSILYVALLLRKDDRNPVIVPLCTESQLKNMLHKNVTSDEAFISKMYRGVVVKNAAGVSLNFGKQLYDLIWKPLDQYLKPKQVIYFSPAGLLHQFAFAALPCDDGTLLSDKYVLNQLSSTAMIDNEAEISPPKISVALFGGINYDLSAKAMQQQANNVKPSQVFISRAISRSGDRGSIWNYLPGTLTEINSIKQLANTNKLAIKIYQGDNAIEENFKNLSGANSPYVIHIATHGFFFPDPKAELLDKLGSSQENFSTSENPLNRSGLLFGGANRVWKGELPINGVEDGIVTAYEVSNLHFGGTKLIVLSACETGLGEIKGSEGVFGLQRSFKMAGATYLMMSLWKVPDQETAEFMYAFYEKLFSGKSIPESFIASQNDMKKKYPNEPYKWAAFILVK